MTTIWQIGSRDDRLGYYVAANSDQEAIKTLEALIGPQNPSRRIIMPLTGVPEGYKAPTTVPSVLDPSDEE